MDNEYRGLMYAAAVDASTVQALARDGIDRHPESIAYHSQQAAEKMLKAAFDVRETDFPFTHNIKLLLSKAQEHQIISTVPDEAVEAALYLSGLISVTRYAEAPDLQEGEARQAIQACNIIADLLEDEGCEAIHLRLNE